MRKYREIIMTLDAAYNYLYEGALIVLAILIGAMLIRSIMGPAVTDRVLAINMIGTMVISAVAILSQYLKESYLLDVGLIYTMISFISVLVLASVYIPFRAGSKADGRISAGEKADRRINAGAKADGRISVGEKADRRIRAGSKADGRISAGEKANRRINAGAKADERNDVGEMDHTDSGAGTRAPDNMTAGTENH